MSIITVGIIGALAGLIVGVFSGICIAAFMGANHDRERPENYVLRGKFGEPRGLKEVQRRQEGKGM